MKTFIDDKFINELLSRQYNTNFILSALEKDSPLKNIDEFNALIRYDLNDKSFNERLAKKAQAFTLNRFGRVKNLYIPLYVSNKCSNKCAYCGFRVDNDITRKILDENEIYDELTAIYEKGFRSILLVAGEWDLHKNIDYFVSTIKIARRIGFHSISLEIGSLSDEDAKILADAGAEGYTLYQETYHPETYDRVHLAGLKKNYLFRLNAHDRALNAGFRRAGVGFLAGLYDPYFEILALYEHICHLKKLFWDKEVTVSIPRITKAFGINEKIYTIDDKLFTRMLMVLRLAFPDMPILMSTREKKEFRDGLANICVTNVSVMSKTFPGGYKDDDEKCLEQFSTIDNRDIPTLTSDFRKMGYDLLYKDWEISLNVDK